MSYVPDWEPLADAVKRIVASSVEEDQAKLDLCRAIADDKIAIRATISKPGKPERIYLRDNVRIPKHLGPQAIDWGNSRPNSAWWIGPALGQHYNWDGKDEWIDVIEVATEDVAEVLRLRSVQSPGAELRRGRKPNIPAADIQEVVFELMGYRGNISKDDPEWNTQGKVEVATSRELARKYGAKNVPTESALRPYVRKALTNWRVLKGL